MNIEHTLAHGLVCIRLHKKVRLILHGGYPIMAYYNPIILDNIPIKPLYTFGQGTTLGIRVGQFLREIEVLFQCKGFKLQEVSQQKTSQ